MASHILLTLATLQGVRAWGALGHATIAYIAQNYVTDEVASWYVYSKNWPYLHANKPTDQ